MILRLRKEGTIPSCSDRESQQENSEAEDTGRENSPPIGNSSPQRGEGASSMPPGSWSPPPRLRGRARASDRVGEEREALASPTVRYLDLCEWCRRSFARAVIPDPTLTRRRTATPSAGQERRAASHGGNMRMPLKPIIGVDKAQEQKLKKVQTLLPFTIYRTHSLQICRLYI